MLRTARWYHQIKWFAWVAGAGSLLPDDAIATSIVASQGQLADILDAFLPTPPFVELLQWH